MSPQPSEKTNSANKKIITLVELVVPLCATILVLAIVGWQVYGTKSAQVQPELIAAERSFKANNVQEARRQFDKLISTAPQSPEPYALVMNKCETLNQWEIAIEYGQRAIQACKYAPNAERAGLYMLLAGCYDGAHEAPPQPKARKAAERAMQLDPDNPLTLNALGYTMADNAQTEQDVTLALGYIQKALAKLKDLADSDQKQLQLYMTEDSYGWALYKQGQYHAASYALAVDALNHAIDDMQDIEVPGDGKKVLYYHLGAACHAAGRIEDARHALQVALHYDPKYPEALKELNALPPTAPAAAPPSTKDAPATPGANPSANSTSHVPAPASSGVTIASPLNSTDGKPVFQPLDTSKATHGTGP